MISKQIAVPVETVFEAATDNPDGSERITFRHEAAEEMEIMGFDAPRFRTTEAEPQTMTAKTIDGMDGKDLDELKAPIEPKG